MARPKLTEGRWFVVNTASEHKHLLEHGAITVTTTRREFGRVQRGKFVGPGRYLELTWLQRCPRNCCNDFVRELLPADDVAQAVREEMAELSQLLKAAREVVIHG